MVENMDIYEFIQEQFIDAASVFSAGDDYSLADEV
jgi:hypothetical protein